MIRTLSKALCFSAASIALMGAAPSFADDLKDAGESSVQLATIGIPVVVNRQVVNYLFLSVRVDLTDRADENKLRDMEPYFRDAMVRAAHKVSFAQAAHDDQLDVPRFDAAMVVEFSKVAGPGMVKSVTVVSQNPQRKDN